MADPRPTPIRTSTLLRRQAALVFFSALAAPFTVLLGPLLLMGFVLFGLLTEHVVRHHVKDAFGGEVRLSFLGAAVVAALALVCVGVGFGWAFVSVSEYSRVGHVFRLLILCGGAAILYIAMAWALTPLALFVALSSDAAAPAEPRARLLEAFRVSQALPRRVKVRGVLASGAVLLLPFAAMLALAAPLWASFYLVVSISVFPALSSALTVSAYSHVRLPDAAPQPRVDRTPGSLFALGIVAVGLTAAAFRVGAGALWSWSPVLVVAWLGVLAVGLRLAAAARLASIPRFQLDQPPGRALLEGTLRFVGADASEGVRLDCEGLSVSIASSESKSARAGQLATLVGDFEARPVDFRSGADLRWPRAGRLYYAPLGEVVERRITRAYAVGFVLLAAICLLAGSLGAIPAFETFDVYGDAPVLSGSGL